MTGSIATLQPPLRHNSTIAAAAAVILGCAVSVGLGLAGVATTLVPVSIGWAAALLLIPFPLADRLLAISLIATMPVLWIDALPNVPLAAAVIVIGLIRVGPIELRSAALRTWLIIAATWVPLAIGVALASWPPVSVWLRPAGILLLSAAAAILGGLVWVNPDRRQRWLEGIALGLVLVSLSGLVVFGLQFFIPFATIVEGFADLQALLRGAAAGETFRVQNNWLIPGEQVTLRAISPLFPSPNNLGAYLGIATPIAFLQVLSHPLRGWRLTGLAGAAIGIAVVVLTFSRSTWLATALAGGLMVALIVASARPKRAVSILRRRVLTAGLLLAAVALGALVLGASAGGSGVVDRIVDPMGDESVTDRLDTGDQALVHVAMNPLHGTGLGAWRATIADQDDVAYIHNVYLEYAAAAGVPGGLWAVMTVAIPLVAGGVVLTRARRIRERLLGAVILGMFAFAAVHFLFDDNLLNPQYSWLLFFAHGGSISAAWGQRPQHRGGRPEFAI